MQNFPGTGATVVNAQQTLGGAAGRTISLASGLAGALTAVRVTLVATATVGNRVLTLQAKDATAGNILFQIPMATAVTAGQTASLTWAASAPFLTSGTTQVANLPAGFVLPTGAAITIFDAANIDVADTIATNIAMTV